jgi:hypothetical protein
MGLKIRLKNIESNNSFKVYYKEGRTPGQNQTTGFIQYLSTFPSSTTTITIDLTELVSNPYGKQFWFKIIDNVTQNYIIENIYIHERIFYNDCTCCISGEAYTNTCDISGEAYTNTCDIYGDAYTNTCEIYGEAEYIE